MLMEIELEFSQYFTSITELRSMAHASLFECTSALEGTLKELFYFTVADPAPCGGRKKSPLTSVQTIFYFSPLRSEDIF